MMGLTGKALKAATELLAKYPDAVITSGRRNVTEQAMAMAKNIVADRKFIVKTYVTCKAALACQQWIDEHPTAEQREIQIGIGALLRELPSSELGKLSKHLGGLAFDIQPVDGTPGALIRAELVALAKKYGGKFLDHEGSLVRWHWQC